MSIRDMRQQAVDITDRIAGLLAAEEYTEETDNLVTSLRQQRDQIVQEYESIAALDNLTPIPPAGQEDDTQPEEEEPVWSSGVEFLRAVRNAGRVRGRSLDSRLVPFGEKVNPGEEPQDAEWYIGNRRDATGLKGVDGGFLIPTAVEDDVFFLPPEMDDITPRATVLPMSTRSIEVPRLDQYDSTSGTFNLFGGITTHWTREGTNISKSTPQWGSMTITAETLAAYTVANAEFVDDAIVSFAAWLRSPVGFVGAIAAERARVFINGTGAGQPKGYLNSGATITVQRNTAGTILFEDVVGMLQHLYEGGSQAVWMTSRTAIPKLAALKDNAGNHIFLPSARESVPDTLMGRPIVYNEVIPTLGTAGDLSLAVWPFYYIGERGATTLDASQDEFFRQNQISYRALHRVGGRPALDNFVTLHNGHTVSPFVKLVDAAT